MDNLVISEADDLLEVDFKEYKYILTKEQFDKILLSCQNKKCSKTVLYDENNFEILLSKQYPTNYFSFVYKQKSIVDEKNRITYSLEDASDEYTLLYLENISKIKYWRQRACITFGSPLMEERAEKARIKNGSNNFFDLIRIMFRDIMTIKIKGCNRTFDEYSQFFNSFQFQFAYNCNCVIIPLYDFNNLTYEIYHKKRQRITEISAPKRKYIGNLTKQYYLGISSEIPFVKFISYYHIMEYFFNKVYSEDLIRNIQTMISHPGFSIKNEYDILKLVRFITKKIKNRDEAYVINELEALQLVLKKYVDIKSLPERLNEYDNTLIEYYSINMVPFSRGNKIDFNKLDNPIIYKNISERIYKTRNSIIHSKSKETPDYSPFTDDAALLKEIPLMRFIAEDIIISTSELI